MSIVWQALLANVALIAVLMMAWEVASDHAAGRSERWRSALFGAVMGVGAVASMYAAPEIVPGVLYDLRASLIGAAGFFGGPIAALLSATLSLVYRLQLGGQGFVGGIISILIAFAVGLIAHGLTRRQGIRFRDVSIFAIVVPVASLLGYLVLPREIWVPLLQRTGLAITILSFANTLLIATALYRERRRRELARQNLIYRAMVQELPDCLNVKDLEGRFIAANRPTAQLMRAGSQEDLIGKTDFDFYPPELARAFRKDEEAVLVGGLPQRLDQPVHFQDGSAGWLSTLKAPLSDEAGRVIGIITHNRDITAEKRNAEIKDEFISTVSHELRTPLTSIRGSLGLIAAGVAGPLPPKAANLVRIAHSNCERLVLLINDILDIEKIESGKMAFEIKPQRLRPVLEQAIAAAKSYLVEKGVRVLLIDDAPEAQAGIDAGRMHQVAANLLSNAIKYSPEGGIVRVRLGRDGRRLRLEVRDDGAGIPEAFRARVFGKFEQADTSSIREKGGTGLGLSITKAIVEQMGGTIAFATAEGKGTTFTVDLPETVAEASSTGGRQPGRRGARPRVLICDDDGEVAAVIAAMLGVDGFALDVAPDFASAKVLLQDRDYLAMILSLGLADESGTEIFASLRTSSLNADVPVIFISATPDETRASQTASPSE